MLRPFFVQLHRALEIVNYYIVINKRDVRLPVYVATQRLAGTLAVNRGKRLENLDLGKKRA